MAISHMPGSYLNNDTNRIFTFKFRGRLSKIMALNTPAVYHKYMSLENGKILL